MNHIDCLKKISIFFFIITLQNITFAQTNGTEFRANQPFKFKSITIHDGLSQNWVRCIYQDNQGFMWFGTSGGLNRYDGYEFKTYNLGNVNTNAISKKNESELWICNDLGVFIYNQIKDTIELLPHLNGYSVLCNLQVNDSIVWFGTNTGLFRYSIANNKIVRYLTSDNKGLSSNYINKLFLDSNKNIWIGTKTGLNRYVRSTDSFVSYQASGKPGSLSGNDIMAICEDNKNRLWIGTAQKGVNLLVADGEETRFKKIIDGAILSFLIDKKNILWIGTGSNGGILQIDLDRFSPDNTPSVLQINRNRLDPFSLSDNSGFCIYQDNMDDIWIGTYGGGVNHFSYRRKKFYSIKEGINKAPELTSDLVNSIWEEERYLWLGTEGGLDQFDKLNKTTKHYRYEANNSSSLSSDFVYSIHKDSRGNLWVGTWSGGLHKYNYQTKSFQRFVPDNNPGSISSENIFSIYEDSRKNLWVATIGGGLNKFNYETGTFVSYRHNPDNPKSLHFDIIHDVKETSDGRIWVASYGSLDLFDYVSEDFTHYLLKDIDSSNLISRYIITIFVDSQQNIWLGTNNGLLMFDKTKTEFIAFTIADGLAGNTVQAITEDNLGNLWISTNNGLSKYANAVKQPESGIFFNFNELDGLAGNDFKSRSVFKNKNGLLYFGTSQGFSYFHPDSIYLNPTPPNVAFVEMQLLQFQEENKGDKPLNQNINSIEKIVLPYNKSDFTITFAALNYLTPEDNKYKYRLDGYDPDWVFADNNRMATYKNLKPGDYTFMVLASNNDGVWSNTPKSIQITINPPFWQTWLFRIFLFILLLYIIYLSSSLRLKAIKREKRKLEKLVAERTIELKNANDILEEQSDKLINQNEELIQNQEQLSLYKDHLEELVARRTKELEKAKNKAEESDMLKTCFLTNMSHEIRTPLNAIAGFTDLYNRPKTNDETRKRYQTIIKTNVDSLLNLVDDILDISTIEANQLKIDITHFSPAEILRKIYLQFLPQASETIEFRLLIDEKYQSITIASDEHRFRQILTNLVSNAFKFTEHGSIEIGYYPGPDEQIIFYVKDTGIGISKEEQQIIFDRFTKIEDSIKIFRGAGLGLAISKELTILLGGKIWIESEPGKGSTFFFSQKLLI